MNAERPVRYPNEPSKRARSKGPSRLPRLKWLLVAVGLCWLSWPAPAEAQTCEHDICEFGPGMVSGCDPCVTEVCAVDPFCCQFDWDDSCVEKVMTVCEDWICTAACSHNLCEIGEPLDSTCTFCAAKVCFNDPSCCADSWDASCVFDVQQDCGYQCAPGANRCSEALPITPGRIFGTLTDSTNDGCETAHVSCQSGDVWYEYTPVVVQDFVLSTCSTQRAFGIDTVISVHEGCPGNTGNEIISNDDYRQGLLATECANVATPNLLDSALPLGGFFQLAVGETVLLRVSHHEDSVKGNFELRLLPEPEVWLAFVAGAGALGALSRRRARR